MNFKFGILIILPDTRTIGLDFFSDSQICWWWLQNQPLTFQNWEQFWNSNTFREQPVWYCDHLVMIHFLQNQFELSNCSNYSRYRVSVYVDYVFGINPFLCVPFFISGCYLVKIYKFLLLSGTLELKAFLKS